MKIEFFTQDDPLYVLPFFEEFVRHYSDEFKIVSVSSAKTMGKRSRRRLLKELGHLYGPSGLARLLLRSATQTLVGSLPMKRNAKRYCTLAQLCRAYGIRFEANVDPNSTEFVDALRAREPDLIVSVAFPYILKENLLTAAPLGAINIHHAPLPRYKGMMPTFWQMYHGEKCVGLTIHSMAAKIDEGAALLQTSLPIEPGESLDHLIRRSKRSGAHHMATVLRQIHSRTQRPMELDHTMGSYFTFPTIAEIREFHKRGLRAI